MFLFLLVAEYDVVRYIEVEDVLNLSLNVFIGLYIIIIYLYI